MEYEAVCQHPERRLAARLTARQVEVFVNSLIALAEPVEAHFRWRPALRDPADEMVLETVANVFNRLNITTRQVAGEWLKSMAAKEWMENQVISH